MISRAGAIHAALLEAGYPQAAQHLRPVPCPCNPPHDILAIPNGSAPLAALWMATAITVDLETQDCPYATSYTCWPCYREWYNGNRHDCTHDPDDPRRQPTPDELRGAA